MGNTGFSSVYYRFAALAVSILRTPGAVAALSSYLGTVRFLLSARENHLYSKHMERFFPDSDKNWFKKILKEYWTVHERNLFSLFLFKSKSREFFSSRVDWVNRNLLDEALTRGKGVLLLVPHFGDERGLHVLLGMAGYSVDVITSRYLDMPEYPRQCRLAAGERWNSLHYPDENPRWMYRTLQSGGIVHYGSTAYGGPGGTWIRNFGVPVLVPSAPWKLTRRTGCTVLMACCRHLPDLGFQICFKPVNLPEGKQEAAEVIGTMTEQLAREYPGQYTWKNLAIRHRESNTIQRLGRIPELESELEMSAVPEDNDPAIILREEACSVP